MQVTSDFFVRKPDMNIGFHSKGDRVSVSGVGIHGNQTKRCALKKLSRTHAISRDSDSQM